MLKDHQIKIVMLMYELELTLVTTYTLFTEKFSEHNTLWQTLIKEEQEHADAVRKLYQLTYKKEVFFDEGRIKAEGVQSIIDYLKGVCEEAERGKLTSIQALEKAHGIESSLIERNLFCYFKSTGLFAQTLRFLHEGSQSHIELTKNELNKAREVNNR